MVVQDVLKKEFPKGMNIVYESVGGEMFKTCLGALGRQGRLVVIGMMSQYGGALVHIVYCALAYKLVHMYTLYSVFSHHCMPCLLLSCCLLRFLLHPFAEGRCCLAYLVLCNMLCVYTFPATQPLQTKARLKQDFL